MSRGYHLCVRNINRRVTIHAPTDKWEHLPRGNCGGRGRVSSYWMGPYKSEADAAGVAGDLAYSHDYELRYCKPCFPDKFPLPPTRGDHIRGIEGRRKHARERGGRP